MLNHKVDDVLAEREAGRFDAVFVAIGAHVSRHVDIPARDAARVLDAVSLLREIDAGERPLLGRRVVVYGGGNTAMDAARTARRLGAEEALIVYRRDRAHMPAHAFEADEALAEGVKIKWLTTIKEIVGPSLTVERWRSTRTAGPSRRASSRRCRRMRWCWRSARRPRAASCAACPGIEFKADGTVIVGPDMMTGHPGVFAGGDMVPSERTVTVAVGHGKLAARHIDAWLRGARYEAPQPAPLVSFAMLHLPMFSDADRSAQRTLEPAARVERIRRGRGRPDRAGRALRGAALPELRQSASSATTATPPVPRTRSSSSGRAALPLRLREVHRLRRLLRAVPVPRDRDDPGAVVTRDRRARTAAPRWGGRPG